MNTPEEQKKQAKAEYMRNYMRVWKQKKYDADPQSILRNNRTNYIIKKGVAVSPEDKAKYGSYLETYIKTRGLLQTLITNRPDLLDDIKVMISAV